MSGAVEIEEMSAPEVRLACLQLAVQHLAASEAGVDPADPIQLAIRFAAFVQDGWTNA